MDLNFSVEQKMFATTVRTLLSRRAESGEHTSGSWDELAELGVLGLGQSEEHGGLGGGMMDVAAVMTEVGRTLSSEPVVECALVPSALIAELGTPDQQTDLLAKISSGELRLALAHLEPDAGWEAAQRTKADPGADGVVLRGEKWPVLGGATADAFLVSAMLPGEQSGLFLVDASAPGMTAESHLTHGGPDVTHLVLDGVPATRLGDGDVDTAVSNALLVARLAVCSEAVGVMDRALEMTVEHLKSRTQFGQPLARFQALTHRAADLYVAIEMARALTTYACARHAAGDADPLLGVRAKLQVGRSARKVGQEVVQLHGGIGMTTEHAVSGAATRLLAIEHTYGSTEDQLRQLVAQLRDHAEVTP